MNMNEMIGKTTLSHLIQDVQHHGPAVALFDVPERDLVRIIGILVEKYSSKETKVASGFHRYCETGALTRWEINDINSSMRHVWIVKIVTRSSNYEELKKEERTPIITIDREIAQRFIDVLNAQECVTIPYE